MTADANKLLNSLGSLHYSPDFHPQIRQQVFDVVNVRLISVVMPENSWKVVTVLAFTVFSVFFVEQ